MFVYAYFTYFILTTSTYIIFGCEHYHDPACQNVNPIDGDHFMNQFIAEIEGGEEVARRVARDIGFQYMKPMKTHENHYFFTHAEVYDRHKTRHVDVLKILREHNDVKTADQQYVWHPTINEIETYEDMVGLDEPLDVKTSHFHPDEIEIEGRSAWELVRPDDVFTKPEPIQDYPPIHTLVDFEKLYAEKNREKERRAEERRLQEALEKKLEEEIRTSATSVTSDSETDLHEQNNRIENSESDEDGKVLGNEEIDKNKKPEKGLQDEKIEKEEKLESINDEKIAENQKNDLGEKLESAVNEEVLENEKIDKKGDLKSSGDGKVLENPKIGEEQARPEIEGESGKIETPSVGDDEATVETYEE